MAEGSDGITACRCDSETNGLGSCEAHHVSGSPQKDSSISTFKVGEDKGWAEEGCLEGRNSAMEATKVPLKEIKTDPLAHELATSEGMKPYLHCLIKAHRNNGAGLEAALRVIRDLPPEKRYTWRVLSALKWAFADFEDEYVALDLTHIPEPTRSEMTKELERRLLQLRMLLQIFRSE
jgi:hypothetical protein